VQENRRAWEITEDCVEEKLPVFLCPHTPALVGRIEI
jgi:hypothetical protein